MDPTSPWNDPEIPDDDMLYRRVPKVPDFYLQRDVLTNEPRISRNAFQFDDDGMSVYRRELIRNHRLSLLDVRRNDRSVLFEFSVETVRKLSAGYASEQCGPAGWPPPWSARSG